MNHILLLLFALLTSNSFAGKTYQTRSSDKAIILQPVPFELNDIAIKFEKIEVYKVGDFRNFKPHIEFYLYTNPNNSTHNKFLSDIKNHFFLSFQSVDDYSKRSSLTMRSFRPTTEDQTIPEKLSWLLLKYYDATNVSKEDITNFAESGFMNFKINFSESEKDKHEEAKSKRKEHYEGAYTAGGGQWHHKQKSQNTTKPSNFNDPLGLFDIMAFECNTPYAEIAPEYIRVYRLLSKAFHPDKRTGEEAMKKMKTLNDAKTTFSNEFRFKYYKDTGKMPSAKEGIEMDLKSQFLKEKGRLPSNNELQELLKNYNNN